MKSAVVLNDELSRADTRHLAGALEPYEKRRRRYVARLQHGLHTMFRMETTRDAALSTLRDVVFRIVPEGMLLKDVEKSLEQPL